MPSDEYKNIKKIKGTTGRIRAQRLAEKDIEVLPNGEVINVPFGESLAGLDIKDDFLELHIYDEGNRLIQSVYKGIEFLIDGDGGTKKLVLNPGNDLRNNGFRYGRYRVVYNVFKELVGSRYGSKVRIQEISSTRKEIRILPIREHALLKKSDLSDPNAKDLGLEKVHQDDREFYYQFDAFGEGRDYDVLEYDEGTIFSSPDKYRAINIAGGRFRKNFVGKELIVTLQNGDVIYRTKIKKFINPQKVIVADFFTKNGVRAPLPKSKYVILVGVQENIIPKKDLKNLAVFGDNQNYVVSNWDTDFITFEDFPHSIVLRFYDALPNDIQVKDKFWIVREQVNPIIESIQLLSELDEEPSTKLKPPNFQDNSFTNLETSDNKTTQFESWDNLLSTGSLTRNQLFDKYLGTDIDLNSTELNINYEKYSNYVHFGSTTERVKNFKYKLGLIEGYTETSQSLAGLPTGSSYTSSIAGKSELYNIDKKIRNVKNGFDGFEKYMYFESSSVAGGKYGKTWPKETSTRPYTLTHTTGSAAVSWYDEQLISGSAFDRNNPDYLVNNIPLHVVEDEQNDQFVLFLDMIGQHFDSLWIYIKNLTQLKSRKEQLDEGIPKDLVYAIGKSLGWKFNNGNTLEKLWEYGLGVNEDGSNRVATVGVPNDEQSLSKNDITKQVWKRIINNLPYILKTKGTRRGIKALLSCYGMPSSFIDIKEYGGPEPNPSEPSFFRKDLFSYNLNFTGSNTAYISSSWQNYLNNPTKPSSLQLRFRTFDTTDNQVLVQSVSQSAAFGEGNWAIRLNEFTSSTNMGRVEFALGPASDSNLFFRLSSSLFPIADKEHYSAMVTRETSSVAGEALDKDQTSNNLVLERDITYKLYVGKYDSGKRDIQYKSITSMSLNGNSASLANNLTGYASASNKYFTNDGHLYFGGSGSYYGKPFSGSIQEFRAWNEVLDKDSFDDFTRAPKSVYGNTFRSSFNKLGLHYDFDDKKNHSTDSTILDKKPNSATAITASAIGYNTNVFHYEGTVDQHQFLYPNVGANRPASKTRVEDNKLVHGNLNTKKSVEASGFDTAPLDSPKLGVYFSPTNIIDQDIIATFGNTNFDDFIGSPIDMYKDNYEDLQTVRGFYYQRYDEVNSFTEYIDLLKYYDLSLFEQIRNVLPARAQATVGIMVEPTLLERPKIKYKPIRTNKGRERFEQDIDLSQEVTPGGEYLDEESVVDVNEEIEPSGEASNIEVHVKDMATDIEGETISVETTVDDTDIIDESGNLTIIEGEISKKIIRINPPKIREVSSNQPGNIAIAKFQQGLSSSLSDLDGIQLTGSLKNSVEFLIGSQTDTSVGYVFPTGSFTLSGNPGTGVNVNGMSITGSNGELHNFLINGNPSSELIINDATNTYQVRSGSSVTATAINFRDRINDKMDGFMSASNVAGKVMLTGSLEVFPPANIPIRQLGSSGITSPAGMGGGKVKTDIFYYTSSVAQSHKTGSDMLANALVNKVNNAFSSSTTYIDSIGRTGMIDSTHQYITASFLPQYSTTKVHHSSASISTQIRTQPEIIFKTTINRDFKASTLQLTGSRYTTQSVQFFDFDFIKGITEGEVTVINKDQLPILIPSLDGGISNTEFYVTFGSQNGIEGTISNINAIKQSGETIVLEGEVTSLFLAESPLYHVSHSSDGNPVKDGNILQPGKVFRPIEKKQSKHYNISVKKFVVDSNHPSGSGVRFGSAYIIHERTKGADANLISDTSLRRVFYEGIKMKSDGPVNINLNPNDVDSKDTIDLGPVVEVNIVSPSQILVSEPGNENNLYVDNIETT